jgi:hypothetical protein
MGRMQEGPNGLGLSPHIQHLRPHHRGMARAVALGNRRPKDLAEMYGFSDGQISRIMGSPAFQAEVARLQQEMDLVTMDAAKDLQMMAETAIQVIDEDLHQPITSLEERKHRSQTALEVLGMVGIRKTGGGGNTTLILNKNEFHEKETSDMDPDELRNEVLDLIKEPSGAYS